MPSCAVAGLDVSFRTLEGGERVYLNISCVWGLMARIIKGSFPRVGMNGCCEGDLG